MTDNIVLVTSSYPRWENDHAGQFIENLASELRNDFPVRVIAPDYPGSSKQKRNPDVSRFTYFVPKPAQTLAYGYGIYENLRSNPLRCVQIPSFLFKMKSCIRRHINQNSILIANWLFPAGWIGSKISAGFNIPMIAIAHGSDIHLLRKLPFGRNIACKIISSAKKTIVVANYQKSILEGWLNKHNANIRTVPIDVIPMGYPLLKSNDEFDSESKSDKKFRILFMSRLIRLKGCHILLEALKGMKNMTVDIAGDGPERKSLQNYATQNKIDIVFHGWVDSSMKARLFKQSDLYVCPSIVTPSGRTDGMPVTVLEAMSSGIPVIASHVGGLIDMITNKENGILVKPEDPEELSTAILELVQNNRYRFQLSENARKTAQSYSQAAIGKRYRDIVQSVIATKLDGGVRGNSYHG